MRISTKPTPFTLGLGIIGATPDELAEDTKAGVLCLVRDERPLSSGPAKPAWMDCLMSGSSPSAVTTSGLPLKATWTGLSPRTFVFSNSMPR